VSTIAIDKQLRARVEEALARISSVREMDGRVLVDLPIMYPSGAMAVVEVVRKRDKYWVSDMGHGLLEAEFMAAHDYYGRVAKKIAEEFTVNFDGNSIFALWVSDGRLEAAIICVANASNKACSEAIRQASDTQAKRQNERIFTRIIKVFGERLVAKTAEVHGQHANWDAHNVVVFPNRQQAVFEFMTSHQNSVSSKFLMFSDIKGAEANVSLNAVVQNIESLDEKAQMIGDVANIVPLTASDDEYRYFARVA